MGNKYTVHGSLLGEVQVTLEADTEKEAIEAAENCVTITSYGDGCSWAAVGIEGDGDAPNATAYGIEWQHAECVEQADDG